MSSRKKSSPTLRPPVLKNTQLASELRTVFAIALGGSALLAANLGHAQEKNTSDAAALQTVTVTAQKREEKAQEIPSAISVLGGKDLLDNGIGRSASEILTYVPNATAGTQQHGRPRWWIRGIGAGQQQIDFPNPVGLYLDDVYISNASATGFPLFDLDRVEVLRGPQGTLWGKNTTGGAINVISNKPSFKNDGYFKADYGSYDTKLIQGAVGGTLKEDVLAGRIAFHSEDQGKGRFNNLFTGEKDGKLRDSAVRGQLQALIGDDLVANLNLHYRDYKTSGATSTVASYAANGVYRNGYIPSKNPDDVSSNAPARSDTTQAGAQLNLQYQLGKLALTSITGYENYKSESVGDGDNTPLEVSRSQSTGESRQFSQEFRLASPREDRVNWVTGLHYFTEDIDSNSSSARLPNGSVPALAGSTQPVTYNNSTYNHKTKSFALFGSTTVNFSEQLLSTFGLRWTKETKDLNLRRIQAASNTATFGNVNSWWNTVTGGNFAAAAVASGNFTSTPSTTWKSWTYDVTPEYKISETLRTYFKYAHGVKSGGYNTSASNVLALNTVAPEKLDAFELGLKSEWLGGRLHLNANVFHYKYKNAQVNITGLFNGDPTQSVSYLQNVAKGHVNGAELEIEALPTENLHINANLGLLQTRFDEFDIQNNGGSRAGNEFVRSPHVTALLAADYRIPVSNGGKVILGGDWRYTSKQFFYVDPQTNARSFLNQDGYSIANARVSYVLPGGKHTFTAYVNNLADTIYQNHALTSFVPGTVDGDTVIWGQRRTIGVNYKAQF
ncbi:TonB-dependent receptor [Janthinobacterium sp. 17J80-10]|uniref:TonB-dependent receptor n=1 Tax=Janthinobacterium sp. 17J80-10 TaxID=2497863 RepID=UPI00100565AD|nr:TonB-dependent receptor [Janthinobacterium sp. 17J80-10]QAU33986.1 TonB-dependent receptor [Janthinobacterium sp. 17J80-10]